MTAGVAQGPPFRTPPPPPLPLLSSHGPAPSSPAGGSRVGPLWVSAVVAAADVPPGPPLPYMLSLVAAGFPSPADDYVGDVLDLHELTGAHAAHCYFVRVDGYSMKEAGIFPGDVLVVDRAAEPATGCVVIACVDGEMTVKRLVRRTVGGRDRVVLLAENDEYDAIEVGEEQDLVIWGVVTYVLHDLRVRAPRGPMRGPARHGGNGAVGGDPSGGGFGPAGGDGQ